MKRFGGHLAAISAPFVPDEGRFAVFPPRYPLSRRGENAFAGLSAARKRRCSAPGPHPARRASPAGPGGGRGRSLFFERRRGKGVGLSASSALGKQSRLNSILGFKSDTSLFPFPASILFYILAHSFNHFLPHVSPLESSYLYVIRYFRHNSVKFAQCFMGQFAVPS